MKPSGGNFGVMAPGANCDLNSLVDDNRSEFSVKTHSVLGQPAGHNYFSNTYASNNMALQHMQSPMS